jgi:hypothetical protein
MESQKDIGFIAPLLLWPDGEAQTSVRKFRHHNVRVKLIEIVAKRKALDL